MTMAMGKDRRYRERVMLAEQGSDARGKGMRWANAEWEDLRCEVWHFGTGYSSTKISSVCAVVMFVTA